VTLTRLYLIGFVLYGALVTGGMIWVFQHAATGPHTMLAHDVLENQLIKSDDVISADQADIVGHYARRRILAGRTITPDDVTEKRASLNPSLAVLVSYDRASQAKPLTAGDRVFVCLDNAPIAQESFEVDAVVCDDQKCAATIALKDVPKALQDDGAPKRLRLTDAVDQCKKK
jgi:hypothetical protein